MWAADFGEPMEHDAFSQRHPLVNFMFFVGAIGCSAVLLHPAYLAAELLCAGGYYLLLNGRKGWKMIAGLLPLALFLAGINPLFNTRGQTVLFYVLNRPYTAEALLYGAVIAGMFAAMVLWFGCYNAVLTGDKFTSLFGNLIPALSLVLVMVLRMIPGFLHKIRQISGARKSIGKGAAEGSSLRERLQDGLVVLSALTDWALDGSVVTCDSMRARGYGTARRSSFRLYRMKAADWALLGLMAALLALLLVWSFRGAAAAEFTPRLYIAPLTAANLPGLAACCLFLLIPIALQTKETIQWHISRSNI